MIEDHAAHVGTNRSTALDVLKDPLLVAAQDAARSVNAVHDHAADTDDVEGSQSSTPTAASKSPLGTDAQGDPIRSLAMAWIPANARSKRSAAGPRS